MASKRSTAASRHKKDEAAWSYAKILLAVLVAGLILLIAYNLYLKPKVQPQPMSAADFAAEARKSYQSGNYVSAVKYFKKAVELAPGNASYYRGLGSSYFNLRYYKSALQNYQKALGLEPKNAPVLALVGSVYRNTGNYSEAFYYYNLSLAINPKYSYAYSGIGSTYYLMKDYDAALRYLSKAYNLNPRLKYTANFLASIYLLREDYDSAINIANDKLKHDSNDYGIYRFLGFAYFMKKDIGNSISSYQKALQLAPSTNKRELSSLNAGLGMAYLRNMEHDKAISHFEISLKYAKTPVAYGGLAAADYFLKNTEESKNNLHRMELLIKKIPQQNAPVTAMDVRALGLVYWEQKYYFDAIKHYETAIKLNPGNYAFYYELGRIYLEIGDKAKAANYFKKSLELNKDNADAQKLLLQIVA